MNTAVTFILVTLAIVVFISALLKLLFRFLMKHHNRSSISQSNTNPVEISESSDPYQRQLQHLFNLHDLGLDQALIDSLPVFLYEEIIGLKEPFDFDFDCAVCLSQFSQQDMLRLLPICNHAFHIHCIDTWLLTNSTCPLCRGSLYESAFAFEIEENPVFVFEERVRKEEEEGGGVSGSGCGSCDAHAASVSKHAEKKENHIMNGKRVFSVRLGKFRSSNNGGQGVERGEGECSSTSTTTTTTTTTSVLDVRRCYSMGSFQYVVADSDLQVALCTNRGDRGGGSMRQLKGRLAQYGNSSIDEEKKINIAGKGESYSVSKIWLWSRKDKASNLLEPHLDNSNVTASSPWKNGAQGT